MTDKLTLQDCFKYPKAKIKRIYDAEVTGTYKNIRLYQTFLYMVKDTIKLYPNIKQIRSSTELDFEAMCNISNCKLILRDISELTDEERKHILNNFIFDLYIDTVGISEIVWNNFDDLLACCEHRKESIDYLRSINIDIDGFLKSGKAVKG